MIFGELAEEPILGPESRSTPVYLAGWSSVASSREMEKAPLIVVFLEL